MEEIINLEGPVSKPVKGKKSTFGKIISTITEPKFISYGIDKLLVPPFGEIKKVNKSKISVLPKGIHFIEGEK